MARIVLAALLLALLAACATEGAYMQDEEFDAIKASITTAEELEAELGIPSVIVPRPDNKMLWVYQGIHHRADVTQFIPYVNIVLGTTSQECTRLTVLVDRDNGDLSDWEFVTARDIDYWANVDDKCSQREKRDTESETGT